MPFVCSGPAHDWFVQCWNQTCAHFLPNCFCSLYGFSVGLKPAIPRKLSGLVSVPRSLQWLQQARILIQGELLSGLWVSLIFFPSTSYFPQFLLAAGFTVSPVPGYDAWCRCFQSASSALSWSCFTDGGMAVFLSQTQEWSLELYCTFSSLGWRQLLFPRPFTLQNVFIVTIGLRWLCLRYSLYLWDTWGSLGCPVSRGALCVEPLCCALL